MTEELLTKGNITTIATWLAIIVTGLLTYVGYELDYTLLIPAMSFLITFCIAVYSSKHPNTLKCLGNDIQGITVTLDSDQMDKINAVIAEAKESAIANQEVEVDEDAE